MTHDHDPFVVDVETGWTPPTGRARRFAYARMAMELLAAATGTTPSAVDPASGQPRWRVTLHENGVMLAASRWRDDWASVEQMREQWLSRVRDLSASEVRSMSHRWAGE